MTRNYKARVKVVNPLSELPNIEYRQGLVSFEDNPSDDEIKAIVEGRILSEADDILEVEVFLLSSANLTDILITDLPDEHKAVIFSILDELYVAGDSEQTHLNVANLISKLIK